MPPLVHLVHGRGGAALAAALCRGREDRLALVPRELRGRDDGVLVLIVLLLAPPRVATFGGKEGKEGREGAEAGALGEDEVLLDVLQRAIDRGVALLPLLLYAPSRWPPPLAARLLGGTRAATALRGAARLAVQGEGQGGRRELFEVVDRLLGIAATMIPPVPLHLALPPRADGWATSSTAAARLAVLHRGKYMFRKADRPPRGRAKHVVRMLLVGAQHVGKRSLLRRWTRGEGESGEEASEDADEDGEAPFALASQWFQPDDDDDGVAMMNENVVVHLGRGTSPSVIALGLHVSAIVLVFDSPETLAEAEAWLAEAAPPAHIPRVLIRTKHDRTDGAMLGRQLREAVERTQADLGCHTSAQTGFNVASAMGTAALLATAAFRDVRRARARKAIEPAARRPSAERGQARVWPRALVAALAIALAAVLAARFS